jgi:photosystem II stability/assembly factor-like uncharacterized protein
MLKGMRASLVLLFTLILNFSFLWWATAASAGWSAIGPSGGNIKSLAVDPETPGIVYAGTSGKGVYKSTDGGASWKAISSALPSSVDVTSLEIDPVTTATLYAVLTYNNQTSNPYSRVYKSDNGGAKWNEADSGLPATDRVNSVVIDPKTPDTLYAGVSNANKGGVYKSTDGGRSWRESDSGMPSHIGVTCLAIGPETSPVLYAGTCGRGVYKSTDGGVSWKAENSMTSTVTWPTSLAIDPKTITTLYALDQPYGLLKSTDGGSNWEQVNSGLPSNPVLVTSLAIDPDTPSTLYAGASHIPGNNSGCVYKSIDGGSNWKPINAGIPLVSMSALEVACLAIDPGAPGAVYAGTNDFGVFKSINGGTSWTLPGVGLPPAIGLASIAIDPETPATIYAATSFGVIKSINAGASWTLPCLLPFSVTALAIDPKTTTTIYAVTPSLVTGGIYKSTNGGAGWKSINSGLPLQGGGNWVVSLVIDPETPTTLYAGTSGPTADGVYKSTNGGASWKPINSGLPSPFVTCLAIDPKTPATIYAGIAHYYIYKSTDSGTSWQPASNSGLVISSVSLLAIDPKTPSTLYAGQGGYGIYKSTDGAESWNESNSGLPLNWGEFPEPGSVAIDPVTPDTLYAATWTLMYPQTACVYKSINGGKSWTAFNSGLPQGSQSAAVLAIDPKTTSTVYAATPFGAYKSMNSAKSAGYDPNEDPIDEAGPAD